MIPTTEEMLNTVFLAYEGQSPDTYFQSVRNQFMVGNLCVTIEQERRCQEVLDKYKDDKLYAYCCGDLIPIPGWHSDKLNELLTRLGKIVCADVKEE